MKKIIIAIVALLAICLQTSAYNQVRLVINQGIQDQQLKQRMERSVSFVITEINRSHEANLNRLNLPDAYIKN